MRCLYLLFLSTVVFAIFTSQDPDDYRFAREGGNVTLPIPKVPTEKPTRIVWSFYNVTNKIVERDGVMLRYYGTYLQRFRLNATTGSLMIRNVTKRDAGTYYVRTVTSRSDQTRSVVLIVYFNLLTGPNVTMTAKNINGRCEFTGYCSYNGSCHPPHTNCSWHVLSNGTYRPLSGNNPITVSIALQNSTRCYMCNVSTPYQHRNSTICLSSCSSSSLLLSLHQEPRTTKRPTTTRTTTRTTTKSVTRSSRTTKPTSKPTTKTSRDPRTTGKSKDFSSGPGLPTDTLESTPFPSLEDSTPCTTCNVSFEARAARWHWGIGFFFMMLLIIIIIILFLIYRRRISARYNVAQATIRGMLRRS
ncbi:membrane protein S31 [Saimiriine betaherpesvirus 4]|uniref:Membrane protein S31 n=1 Tax=Saimiriine betaherpesvirus 4 TaxID=1535247 RepID=G8XT57_9BETA|nr:membrane protein S31 [Saimiriine betaherpesvirus 4]AEV81006.1 membrane protein S31 [Saimiriine betaherpesvirus 4]